MTAAGWTISIIAVVIACALALAWEREGRRKREMMSTVGERSAVKHEFMSPSWIEMARHEITDALARENLDVEPFTLSEEFTDPPPHLGRGTGSIGFSIRVGRGRVEVRDEPDPAADLRVISDYADAVALARNPDASSNDPQEADRRIDEGRLRIEGDPSQAPPMLLQLDIHRLLAGQTA